MSAVVRFLAKVEPSDSGCQNWQGAVQTKGYGSFQGCLAHRWSFEHFVGPIPEGLTIDHLCRNKLCVNPNHLEPVTIAENNRRANALRTHCKRGHLLAGENVRWCGRCRSCRTCQREVYDAGRVR